MDLLINVLRSPMSFFECTPSGNLLNRFAKEIDAIDCMVPDGLKMMLSYVFKLMEVCIIVLMATPFAAVIILPLAFLYAFVQVHLSCPTFKRTTDDFGLLTLCERWVPLLYVIGKLWTPKPNLLIHLYFVPLLAYILHTFTMNYGKALSDPCWFLTLKLAFYFSTADCRASMLPHPVSCVGWKP